MKHNKVLGDLGEEYVRKYLEKEGYKILRHNFKTSFAEIDIIAQKDEIIAFVEVKTRENKEFGRPAEAVTKSKQRSIRNAASVYIMNIDDKIGRFDVAEIIATINRDGLDVLDFNYIENAFY